MRHIDDDTLGYGAQIMREAEQYLWMMADQPVGHSTRRNHAHFPEKAFLRVIFPKSINPELLQSVKSSLEGRLEIGLVDDVKIAIMMNEKIAAVLLPGLDGRIDFSSGFAGRTPAFHGWCRDLYNFYWDKSKKRLSNKLTGATNGGS